MRIAHKGRRSFLVVASLATACLALSGILKHREILRWYILATQFDRLPANAQGNAEYRHKSSGLTFVYIPSGTFLMRDFESEDSEREGQPPQRQVHVDSFLIAKFEVTREAWVRIMEPNSSPQTVAERDSPVAEIPWSDVQLFCKRLHLQLPTETQWEYACRAGDVISGEPSGDFLDMAWCWENSGDIQQDNIDGYVLEQADRQRFVQILEENHCRPHPVGQKCPNAWGLHDMLGNVAEWCDSRYYEVWVVRGGSCVEGRRDCHYDSRYGAGQNGNVGCRPAFRF